MPSNHTRPDDRLQLTPWLVTKAVLVLAAGLVLVMIAEDTTQLLVTGVLVPIVMLGLIGRHGLRADRSRVPPALQGVCVGVYIGAATAVWVLDGWSWPVFVWVVPLTVLFPQVVPARLHAPLFARAEVDHDAVERARWSGSGR